MKTYCDSFVLCKSNRNTYVIHHTVTKSRYTNVKHHCRISRYISEHRLPHSLHHNNEAKIKTIWECPGHVRAVMNAMLCNTFPKYPGHMFWITHGHHTCNTSSESWPPPQKKKIKIKIIIIKKLQKNRVAIDCSSRNSLTFPWQFMAFGEIGYFNPND